MAGQTGSAAAAEAVKGCLCLCATSIGTKTRQVVCTILGTGNLKELCAGFRGTGWRMPLTDRFPIGIWAIQSTGCAPEGNPKY